MFVFFATPYSQLCDNKYIVKEKYQKFFRTLISKVKDEGINYFLAIERENFGKQYSSDKESTLIDFDAIKKCDLLCAIPGIPASGGVHIELGWASANKKPIELFLKKGNNYSPLVTGLSTISKANYHYYDDDYSDELVNMIIDSIKKHI